MRTTDELFQLPFSGHTLDRAGERRKDEAFLATAAAAPQGRVLWLRDGATIPVDGDGALVWAPSAPALEAGHTLTFLGVNAAGGALFAASVTDAEEALTDDGPSYAAMREVGPSLAAADGEAAVEALALYTWHERHPFCPRCGGATHPTEGGHVRRCASCASDHFPRSDPAVIMLVSDGERCVLGRRIGAAEGRWSTLAGFVDAGESPEAAVAREVEEEVGLRVSAVRYRGSQPWPFPSSLMLAYEATAAYAPLVGNDEHHEVRWFTREEVASGMTGRTMTLPGPVSAGHALIRSWLG
ncbi:MAG TPA: NAD(+) diphosphatase [Acidimicrobiales bacterium]|nr:NAD(+) diphosphatase [Acidimicrobiales bacterium]